MQRQLTLPALAAALLLVALIVLLPRLLERMDPDRLEEERPRP